MVVKNALATSSAWMLLASINAVRSSVVACRIASLVLASTVVAPRIPRSAIASFVLPVAVLGSRSRPGVAVMRPNTPAVEPPYTQPQEAGCQPSVALRLGLHTAGEHLNIVPNSLHSLFLRR